MTKFQLGVILSTIFQVPNTSYSGIFAILWMAYAIYYIKGD